MRGSSERILTTHTGSLPRPESLQAPLRKLDHGQPTGLATAEWDDLVRDAVRDVVARQVAAGVDVVSDGEMGKVSYVTYISQRASGFGGEGRPIGIPDADDFPRWGEPLKAAAAQALTTPACLGDVVYRDTRAVETDLLILGAAAEASDAHAAFVSAASPGVISLFLENQHKDVALADVIDVVLAARPSAISFEAANPRHAHEWQLFEELSVPDGKVLIPGVIDSTTSYVEHPELVAQRLGRFADLVGRERVIAGTDCGFGTFAGFAPIDPDIVYAKLRALRDGADLASERLWGGR